MDEHKQWKRIEHRLWHAAKRLREVEVLMDELGNVEHISGNLTPLIEGVDRFRNLAIGKVYSTPQPEPSDIAKKIKDAK